MNKRPPPPDDQPLDELQLYHAARDVFGFLGYFSSDLHVRQIVEYIREQGLGPVTIEHSAGVYHIRPVHEEASS